MSTVLLVCLYALLSTLRVQAQEYQQQEEQVIRSQVLVLGAGIAGITCANTLRENNVTDFIVLEADDRIGGRMRPFNFQGLTIELGANWIEGIHGNPIWPFKEKLDLRGGTSNFSDILLFDPKTNTRAPVVDHPRYDDFSSALDYATELSLQKRRDGEPDISLKVGLQLGGWQAKDAVDQVIEWSQTDFESAHLPSEASLEYELPGDTFLLFSDEMYMVNDPRGYVSVVHDIASNLGPETIHLNSHVTEVEWAREGDFPVRVVTSQNQVYEAEKVVVTFSLGVLQSGTVQFSPSLPVWKEEAILMSEMTVYTKIFLQFPFVFWDDSEFLLYASPTRGYFPFWHNINHPKYIPGSKVIMVTVTKAESKRIESQPEQQTIQEIMAVLRTIYGAKIPEPIAVKIPIWYNNPLTYGSFASWPLGLTHHHKENLRRPVENQIFFAGDGISMMVGYVHGAYLSGIETATEIVSQFDLQNQIPQAVEE